MRWSLRATIVLFAACGLLIAAHRTADAGCSRKKQIELNNGKKKMVDRIGRPERTFGGRVLLGKNAFPTSARSESAYIGKVRKNTAKRFWEDKKKKEWRVYFVAYFKRPLDDMEVTITLSDITQGYKRQLSAFDQFLDRCATNYTSHMILKREQFGVNKRIEIDVETTRGHVVLASGRFEIAGEADKFTGKADFSDEIKKDKDDDEKAAGAAAAAKKDEPKDDLPPDDPLPGSEKVDYTDPKYMKAPDLDPQKEFPNSRPPPQHKSKGCGCGTTGGEGGTTLLLALGVALAVVRKRRQ